MKKLSILILAALACACSPKASIRPGDLLFVGIPTDYSLSEDSMSSGIAAATGDGSDINWIHTAILDVDEQGTWIIDATIKRGVARYPLDSFLVDFTLKDGNLPALEVMRIKDGPRDLVENAKKFIGRPYDVWFLPDNDALYCTELVQFSYLDSEGNYIFPSAPMNFKAADGTMPLYWEQLFALLGQSVPQGLPGTNPADMRQSPLLEPVNVSLP